MSEENSKIKLIDDLIKEKKEGIRVLFLFKILKTKFKEEIRKNFPGKSINEEVLNDICIKKAREMAKLKKYPSKSDVMKLLEEITRNY